MGILSPVLLLPGICGAEVPWTFGAVAYNYVLPQESDYVSPVVTADRGIPHFEARYNYEDLNTASVWAGANLTFGKTVALEVTPLLGGVFGDTQGWAPGYKAAALWKRLQFYSEGEYLFDTESSADSFFYNWSEFTLLFGQGWSAGLVGQKTRAYQNERDIQRGFLLGKAWNVFELKAHVFNPDMARPTLVISVGGAF